MLSQKKYMWLSSYVNGWLTEQEKLNKGEHGNPTIWSDSFGANCKRMRMCKFFDKFLILTRYDYGFLDNNSDPYKRKVNVNVHWDGVPGNLKTVSMYSPEGVEALNNAHIVNGTVVVNEIPHKLVDPYQLGNYPYAFPKASRKSKRKSRKTKRKSRKASRKTKRKSRKASRKTSRKVSRKSKRKSRKTKRKSRKVSRRY